MLSDREKTALHARVGQTYLTMSEIDFKDAYGHAVRVGSGTRVRVSHVTISDNAPPLLTVWATEWPAHPFAQVRTYDLSTYPISADASVTDRRLEIQAQVRDALPGMIEAGPGITVTGINPVRISQTGVSQTLDRQQLLQALHRVLATDPVERLLLSMRLTVNNVPGDTINWVEALDAHRTDGVTWGAFADWCDENGLDGWARMARAHLDRITPSEDDRS